MSRGRSVKTTTTTYRGRSRLGESKTRTTTYSSGDRVVTRRQSFGGLYLEDIGRAIAGAFLLLVFAGYLVIFILGLLVALVVALTGRLSGSSERRDAPQRWAKGWWAKARPLLRVLGKQFNT